MTRTRLAAAAAALAALLGAPVALAENPLTPVDGGTVVDRCYDQASSDLDDSGYKFCRSLEQVLDDAAAGCRTPLRSAPDATLPEYCGVFDGREVSEARVAAYERSWVHRALTLQRGLDLSAPLWEALIPHTHNSFNASSYAIPTDGSRPSYYATLTNQDPNQVYSMTDQLRMDIRGLEIDLHWVPSPYGTPATRGYWPTMCHGDGQEVPKTGAYAHVGCTYDRPMQDGLAEVRRWLKTHPREFVLLYLENQLFPSGPVSGAKQAHDVAAGIIHDELGSLVYRPPGNLQAGNCASMPYDASPRDILGSGAQVLLVGNCGPGAWNQWVFTRGPSWDESGNPTTYGAKDCAADQAARESHASFRRYYEESPWLEAMTNATQVLTAQTTADLVRCGVNLVGFDQLEPFDGRLEAMVWSWAQGQPASGGSCAFQGGDGRFFAGSCDVARHFACVDGHLDWHVTSSAGPARQGAAACAVEFPGSTFGVPPNGYRNAQLLAARPQPSDQVWLAYVRAGGDWRPGVMGERPRPSCPSRAVGHGHGHGRGHGHGKACGRSH